MLAQGQDEVPDPGEAGMRFLVMSLRRKVPIRFNYRRVAEAKRRREDPPANRIGKRRGKGKVGCFCQSLMPTSPCGAIRVSGVGIHVRKKFLDLRKISFLVGFPGNLCNKREHRESQKETTISTFTAMVNVDSHSWSESWLCTMEELLN